jgi:hypothetical protein
MGHAYMDILSKEVTYELTGSGRYSLRSKNVVRELI